jgi:aminopeptidase N
LLLNDEHKISDEWLELYGEFLKDPTMPPGLKAYFVRIEEQPINRDYFTWFPELVRAREELMTEVNKAYRKELLGLFFSLDTYKPRSAPKDGIEERILKAVLLDLIAIQDTPETHKIILDHLAAATTAQDRVSALIALNRSGSERRGPLLDETYQSWRTHLSAYANYLRIVAAGTRDDVFDMIEAEKLRPSFDITQPTWARALFLSMAANNKMIWTDQGIKWLTDKVIELSGINPYNAGRLLNTFQQYKRLKPELKAKVKPGLERIIAEVPESVSASLHQQAKSYLE